MSNLTHICLLTLQRILSVSGPLLPSWATLLSQPDEGMLLQAGIFSGSNYLVRAQPLLKLCVLGTEWSEWEHQVSFLSFIIHREENSEKELPDLAGLDELDQSESFSQNQGFDTDKRARQLRNGSLELRRCHVPEVKKPQVKPSHRGDHLFTVKRLDPFGQL